MPVSDKRQPRYKRILLKLSGEALMGSENFGIDPKVLDRMALGCRWAWSSEVVIYFVVLP